MGLAMSVKQDLLPNMADTAYLATDSQMAMLPKTRADNSVLVITVEKGTFRITSEGTTLYEGKTYVFEGEGNMFIIGNEPDSYLVYGWV